MQIGMIVRNIITKKKGVVTNDTFGVCSPEQIFVVYDGTYSSTYTHRENLEIIGSENDVVVLIERASRRPK